MMIKKITNIFLVLILIQSLFGVEAKAQEDSNIKAADVVILVDFSGSITDDPRYPEAEKKALQNLVNVSWPIGSNIAILAFGAADSRNGGKPSTFPMCGSQNEVLLSASTIETWIDSCINTIGTTPVGPMTDHNKAIKKAVEILSSTKSVNNSKFVLLMTDGKLDVDNSNPVNPDYQGTGEEKDEQAINELFLEVLPEARDKGIQIWPVGFGEVNRIELNGYAPEGGQPGPDSCQREIPRAVIAEPEDLPYEINKIIRQVTCLGEYKQGENVDLPLPGYADSATINIKHGEGEEFKILGPNGEEINGGGQGTESTVEIPNPSGGNWQVISDSPVTVGYWWESSFEPVVTCPKDDNEVSIFVRPSNNDSDSTTNSPTFNLEVIVNGNKQVIDLELGETESLYLEEGKSSIVADASVQSLDQPGILSFKTTEEECSYSVVAETTISNGEGDKDDDVIDLIVDCELTPDLEECKNDLIIPWWLKRFKLKNEKVTLNFIEHKILRKMDEPRIHFAINCASRSCPKLQNVAYYSHKLEDQLNEAASEFINDQTRNKINANRLMLSKIFSWFKDDFGNRIQLLKFVNKYSTTKILENARIEYLNYDWDLNEKLLK